MPLDWNLDEESKRVEQLRQRVDADEAWRRSREAGKTWPRSLWWAVPFYALVRLVRRVNREAAKHEGQGR